MEGQEDEKEVNCSNCRCIPDENGEEVILMGKGIGYKKYIF